MIRRPPSSNRTDPAFPSTTLFRSFVAMAAGRLADGPWLYAGVALVGAFILPLYSLGVAHTNDRLAPAQMVAASSGLVLVMNVGIVLGPPAAGLAISHLGAPALFGCLAVLQGDRKSTRLNSSH